MRDLKRNQQPVFYKLYEGQEEIVDEYGNPLGSYIPKYGPLKSAMLCVSPNKGGSEYNLFGTLLDYDRTATTSDTSTDIDENTVLWIDGADENGPWNAEVERKAPWKNSVSFAIKNVSVSLYEEMQKQIEKAKAQKAAIESKARVENADDTAEP